LEKQERERQLKIYVASSWRNSRQQEVVQLLRDHGYQVYDFKNPMPGNHGFHWSEISPEWMNWGAAEFREALGHPVAEMGFALDMAALRECDVCVLVLPCGRSAHLEAGYALGAGKPTIILLSGRDEPELMYKMTPYICTSQEEVLSCLEQMRGCIPSSGRWTNGRAACGRSETPAPARQASSVEGLAETPEG